MLIKIKIKIKLISKQDKRNNLYQSFRKPCKYFLQCNQISTIHLCFTGIPCSHLLLLKLERNILSSLTDNQLGFAGLPNMTVNSGKLVESRTNFSCLLVSISRCCRVSITAVSSPLVASFGSKSGDDWQEED